MSSFFTFHHNKIQIE